MKKYTLLKVALSPQKLVGAAMGAAKKFKALNPTAKMSATGTKRLGQIRTFTSGALKSFKK